MGDDQLQQPCDGSSVVMHLVERRAGRGLHYLSEEMAFRLSPRIRSNQPAEGLGKGFFQAEEAAGTKVLR